jgi:hypothetical protein
VRKQSVRRLLLKNNFFIIIILLICISGCEKKYGAVIDSPGSAPTIKGGSFSISVVNTDTINITGQTLRSPEDTLTIRGIAQVSIDSSAGGMNIANVGYSVTNIDFLSSLTEGTLHDDGLPPDAKANDNIYSGYIEFQVQRVFVGTFSVNLWSESTGGYLSNTVILPLQIVRLNHPPVLSNLLADSLISISGIDQKFIQITITATDPDGQSDIRMVYFDSFKPNGSPASGNPFLMYDDGDFSGVSGDSKAGDGIYSLKVGLPTITGTYRFEFHAVDRSNDTSNSIIKNIVVTN